MIAHEFELNLRQMFADAKLKRQEFVGVEHLLLAVLNNQPAQEVLLGCGVDIVLLKQQIIDFIDEQTPIVPDF